MEVTLATLLSYRNRCLLVKIFQTSSDIQTPIPIYQVQITLFSYHLQNLQVSVSL